MRKPSNRKPKVEKARRNRVAPELPQPAAYADHYTAAQMARERGVTERTLARERLAGKGPPYVRDGRRVWYSVPGWQAYLATQEQQPVRQKARAHAAAP